MLSLGCSIYVSQANRAGILQGHCDFPLTSEGMKDAYKTGDALSNVLFTKCFASDLDRARITAETILSKSSTTHDLSITPLLRELSFGVREKLPRGTTVVEAKEIVAKQLGLKILWSKVNSLKI